MNMDILLSLYPCQEAYFFVLSMETCCGAIASQLVPEDLILN